MTDRTPTHYLKCPRCSEDAFGLYKMPEPGEILKASEISHIDEPEAGDEITCQRCGTKITESELKTGRIEEYECEPGCEFCGGFGEVYFDELDSDSMRYAPTGVKRCPNLSREPDRDEE